MSHQPLVTILMSVYNGEEFLGEAIDSILQQTFTIFEFLIIDDGSTDASREIIARYKDKRIRAVYNQKNLGLARSLNKGIGLAEGKYIARMDADDISLPNRLEKQVTFMEEHPEVGVCGSWTIQYRQKMEEIAKCAEWHDNIVANLLFNNSIPHPTVFIRKAVVESSNQYYDEEFRSAQDYEYWTRLSSYCQLYNIQTPLVINRKHQESISSTESYKQHEFTNTIRMKLLKKLQIVLTKEEFDTHVAICNKTSPFSNSCLIRRKQWLTKINYKNKETKHYNQAALERIIEYYWSHTVFSTHSLVSLSIQVTLFKRPVFWPKINIIRVLRILVKQAINA